jgi:cytochrome b
MPTDPLASNRRSESDKPTPQSPPPGKPGGGRAPVPLRVWDLPTRLFHWTLAATLIGSVVSAKIGGNAMVWHFRFGLLMLALLAFRLAWGLVGGHWSRFLSFVPTPGRVLRYLRGGPDAESLSVGHSPIGALSVFALLGLLAVQVATGLVADDEIATQGPLYRFVSGAVSLDATAWHTDYGQYLLIGLIVLHLVAIVVYAVRGRNLVAPMVHGDKHLTGPSAAGPASADGWRHRLVAAVVFVAALGAAAWVGQLG